MWADIFDYSYAISGDTLFISGRSESDMETPAFSLPIGSMPASRSVATLRAYCDENDIPLIFSAVPQYALESLLALRPCAITELDGWADYLYPIDQLSTLSGRDMSKKRNHVNSFRRLYGSECYQALDPTDAEAMNAAISFLERLASEPAPSPAAAMERRLSLQLLRHMAGARPGATPLTAGVLILPDEEKSIAALTISEVKGDTLHIHVEKADRSVPGAYEAINRDHAAAMLERYPQLRYVNRQDDSGDPGLRRAKESYHPCDLLRKYTVQF